MGFGDVAAMRSGLLATKRARAATAGTITVDSYTRVGDLESAAAALAAGAALNGYPLVSHGAETNRRMLRGVRDATFPVQVRHGSADPGKIFEALLDAGLDATEGGPVSYCLPYSRMPLSQAVEHWARGCELLAARGREAGREPHLETFGGCVLGQLCPPSQLVALSVLEAVFFRARGLRDISLSYAQQTDPGQDAEAVLALRALAGEFLGGVRWHVVVYAYMGVYPETPRGAASLLTAAAELAVRTGAERLIVKTEAESRRIPTISENVAALELAGTAARAARPVPPPPGGADSQVYAEARRLIEATLELHRDVGRALLRAFKLGYLDIPYCVHPDNRGAARSYIDGDGTLRWADVGALPLDGLVPRRRSRPVGSAELLDALHYVRRRHDGEG
ncbi:methylaspartate mutase [Bailinhaonella thermotolerans]|uniref:Methylaspartate mutase n=2 Tax=Bailinhaonella thermotolerans TaxID=1070861 RepID=A0A3A4B1A8_9ACTN|nr:methylaspartate mutase [Bailinhaonella thermotolerans]